MRNLCIAAKIHQSDPYLTFTQTDYYTQYSSTIITNTKHTLKQNKTKENPTTHKEQLKKAPSEHTSLILVNFNFTVKTFLQFNKMLSPKLTK